MFDPSTIAMQLAESLETGRHAIARPSQLPPHGEWSIWLLLAGRGFGKTRAAAEWVKDNIEAGRARNVAIVGATAADVRDTCVEGPSGILAISPSWNRPVYEPSKRRVTWPNGATATLFSAEEPDRLRGPNHDLAWCDELASWQNQQAAWDNLMLTLRLGERPRCCISTTPKPTKLLKDLVSRVGHDVVITRGSTLENRANLAPAFLSQIMRKYEGTRLGRQELGAELLEDIEGALWSLEVIESGRRQRGDVPELKRIVVAIDPAVSSNANSDETGIIVAGLGVDGHGYVLADASGKYQPNGWAMKAVALYQRYSADRVVAETNQGGSMVESTLRSVDGNVCFKAVHARRGKMLRAEPVSALYEQGRVHHVGVFAELEDQMTTFSGGGDSPDRLDALVYGMTELMIENPEPSIITYMRNLAENPDEGPTEMPAAQLVRVRVPDGLTDVFGMSGRHYRVDESRIIAVLPDDVLPMRAAGFMEL
jgi:phage terminase large subunit-like protein